MTKEPNDEFTISVNDPHVLDPTCSPLFKFEGKLQGFIPLDFWKSMDFCRPPTNPAFFNDADIHTARTNFERLCQQQSNLTNQDYTSPPSNPTIPPIIHFLWMGSPITKEFAAIIDSWKRCHPGWEIKIWTDEEIAKFPWTNGYIEWLFKEAKSFAEKSDILRYEILYTFGGIYSDIDVICYKSFNDLISKDFNFFIGQEINQIHHEFNMVLYLCGAVMGSVPQHPLLKYCLDHLISQNEDPAHSLLYRNGSGLLTRACQNEFSKEDKHRILVLPCSYFYPLPYFYDLSHKLLTAEEIKKHSLSAESMTLHIWAGTWYAQA